MQALVEGISHCKQPMAPAPGEVRSRIEAATALMDSTALHGLPSQHPSTRTSLASRHPSRRPGFRDPGAAAGDMESLLTMIPRLAKSMGGVGIAIADADSR